MSFLIALALVGAQAAQPAPMNIPQAEAVQVMHQFASCTVRERTGEARAVLAMDFRTAAYRRRLRELAVSNNRCVRRDLLVMDDLTFAGSLAEQLFLRSHLATDPSEFLSSPPPPERSRTEALAYCVVRQSPVEARAVLDTAVAGAEEAAALNALRPAIAACLQGADEARFNRPGLRSLIALALYHLARRRDAS